MSENIKSISRPKVRFFQFSDNVQNEEEAIEHCKEKTILRANGPKIRSIIPVKKSIIITDPKKSTNSRNKNIFSNNCNAEILAHYNGTTSENIQNTSLSNKNMPRVETSKILHNANSIQNAKESCNIIKIDNSLQDNILKSCRKHLQQKEKENKDTVLRKTISDKNISKARIENFQHRQSIAHKKFKFSTKNNDTQKINSMDSKKSKMTKSQSAPNIIKKVRNQMTEAENRNAKFVVSNVMSCYKTAVKNKASPVKKAVLRNISNPKIKTFVELGTSHKRQNDKKTDTNERCIIALDAVAEKLAQPEYNSIMCTINKLKEIKQQRIVTDIDHLPSAQKNFINGKISTALDFPLDEAIYKNLVDLTIDEKELPSTIMRSKDPELRQRDIIPKLIEFFRPEDTNDICEAVQVKPRLPKIDENWNAFKICDKILEWKHSLDDME